MQKTFIKPGCEIGKAVIQTRITAADIIRAGKAITNQYLAAARMAGGHTGPPLPGTSRTLRFSVFREAGP